MSTSLTISFHGALSSPWVPATSSTCLAGSCFGCPPFTVTRTWRGSWSRSIWTRILHSLVFGPSFRCCQFVPFIQCFAIFSQLLWAAILPLLSLFSSRSLATHHPPIVFLLLSPHLPMIFPGATYLRQFRCLTCPAWQAAAAGPFLGAGAGSHFVAFRRWVGLLITSLPLFIELSSCIELSCKKITEHLAVGNTFESIAIHEWDIWFLKCAEIISWVASGLSLPLSLIFVPLSVELRRLTLMIGLMERRDLAR